MLDEIQKFDSKLTGSTYQNESKNYGIVDIFRPKGFRYVIE